ncbi:MAG: hypothetical protein R2729_33020 [Bryobacteraceae bacterium]
MALINYSSLLGNVLLPMHNGVQGRSYCRNLKFLEKSQWWNEQRLREFQWGELRKLLEVTFGSSPYYQRKYKEAGAELGDIRTHEDFAKLPVLGREEIQQHRDEMKAAAYKGKLVPHATGGSSGVPTRFLLTMESFDWRTAATQRAYAWPGCRLGEPTLYLWGAPIGKQSWKQQTKMDLFRMIRREYMFPTFNQTPELWQEIYEYARRKRPPFVVGYVSSIEQFCRYLIDRKLELGGIRAVISAAEAVHDHHRELVAEALGGVPLYNMYGSREFMSIAGECDRRDGLHIHCENLLIETARPASEGPSEILVTDLHNHGMPFIRYKIGDVGVLESTPCGCGRGLPRISRIEGRVLDMLRTSDGRYVPGEFFPHLLKDIPEVVEFQVEQKALDRIVVSVVLSKPMGEASRKLLESEVERVFGRGTRVEIAPVESIPLRASGKRRVTIGLEG